MKKVIKFVKNSETVQDIIDLVCIAGASYAIYLLIMMNGEIM